VTHPDPSSLAKYQCALQLRGPGQDPLFFFLSSFSLSKIDIVCAEYAVQLPIRQPGHPGAKIRHQIQGRRRYSL
jgi:hypothetical protein